MEVSFVFPHQLFNQNPALKRTRPVYLIEEELFFGQYAFHKKKLVLHRASMKGYEQQLVKRGFQVSYIDYQKKGLMLLFLELARAGVNVIHYTDTVDYLLERRIACLAQGNGIRLKCYESPNFLCSADFMREYFTGNKFFQTRFYIDLRKKFHILMDGHAPKGGKWTYDSLNRKKLPASLKIPEPYAPAENCFVREAIQYVKEKFPANPGTSDGFTYPVNHDDAWQSYYHFLKYRFHHYGPYQDALHARQSVLFHSLLSPALNIGLLDPQTIIQESQYYCRHHNIMLNSEEGFIRQLLGWREFIRGVYIMQGTRQRTTNYWGHVRHIPSVYYSGNTGIDPLDQVIRRVLQNAYANHIERLMVIGNFMLLCEFHPDEVYQWFMQLFIDAYDWVMVPNVYGMSQYADGGLMATKPYISSSNYILKMSNHEAGPWTATWDALYWRFIYKHRDLFITHPRMLLVVKQWDKMKMQKKKILIGRAEEYLNSLT
jgi:deoxyribodipyrimidine photolyase-related protein